MELMLNDKYKIEKYNYGFMLLKNIESTNRKTGQKFYHWVEDGYYGKLEQLKASLLEKAISDDLGLILNIDKVIQLKNEILEMKYEEKKK